MQFVETAMRLVVAECGMAVGDHRLAFVAARVPDTRTTSNSKSRSAVLLSCDSLGTLLCARWREPGWSSLFSEDGLYGLTGQNIGPNFMFSGAPQAARSSWDTIATRRLSILQVWRRYVLSDVSQPVTSPTRAHVNANAPLLLAWWG